MGQCSDCTVCLNWLKSTFFENFSNGAPRRGQWSEKKFQTMLILVFEVIVQPPRTHFLMFSSETKIMKITYSVDGVCKNSPNKKDKWQF